MEIWKSVKGFEGLYEVSSCGEVRSVERIIESTTGKRNWKGRTLKPTLSRGYYSVTLNNNNKSYYFKVHRLVALHFLKKEKGKIYINHKDLNKLNNKIENLEFCTPKQNSEHARINSRFKPPFGEAHPYAKLSKKDVLFIKKSKEQQRKLANIFSVCEATISMIKNGRTWIRDTNNI